MENTYTFFSRLIGTLAVILLVAAFAGSTSVVRQYAGAEKKWRTLLIIGLFGGLFGIYGNISGIDLNGAVLSVRDIGPMAAGLIGGPVSGLLAGAIAGAQRLTMGGITAVACMVATCAIGLICGGISLLSPGILKKAGWTLLIGAAMETLHLGVVLLLVKPFPTALGIVRQIALPFVTVNAAGIALMSLIIRFIDRQRSISRESERMKSELEVSSVIQQSLLPTLNERYPGRPEVAVSGFMRPAKMVGGDFYDVFFAGEDKLVFLIGDVSGKSVSGALFMASSKIILQNCIRTVPRLSDALGVANNVLCSRNEAQMFVTLWVGVLDLKSGAMTCVSAGHNPPLLLRGGTAEFLKTKNCFVLAGMEDAKYREAELQLADGDALFLYTDGVTEATTREEELFGNDRLLECLSGCADADVGDVLERVRGSVDAFVGDGEQFDDITMLCFRWKAPEAAP